MKKPPEHLTQTRTKHARTETIQEALDWLERHGLIYRSGEMRPARNGQLQPVYRAVPGAIWVEGRGPRPGCTPQ